MGRTILAAMIVIASLSPSRSEAQASSGAAPGGRATPGVPSGGSFGVTIRHDSPAPPSRSAPTAPAGPLVPQAPPSALDGAVDVFRAGPRTYAPRYDRSARRNRPYGYGAGYGYITDPFGYISQPDSSSPRLDRYMSHGITGYPRDLESDAARDYRDGALARLAQQPPAAPKKFYVIPRCYAGDVPPRAEQLRPGCDRANLREVPPVVAPVR